MNLIVTTFWFLLYGLIIVAFLDALYREIN